MSNNTTFELSDLQDIMTFLENNNRHRPFYHIKTDMLEALSDYEFMKILETYTVTYSTETCLYINKRLTSIRNEMLNNTTC